MAQDLTTNSQTQSEPEEFIAEGEGRFPWWIWVIVLGWLIYAFGIAPFEVTHP